MDDRELIERLRGLLEKATPVTESDLMRYDHGGGRLAILRDGGRKLVADFYGEGDDRELFMTMRLALPTLLDRLSTLSTDREAIRAEAFEEAAKVAESYSRKDWESYDPHTIATAIRALGDRK